MIFYYFSSHTKQDTERQHEEMDRLTALKSYLSHLKKEEMEKFKFPTSMNSDWVPLISTKAGNNYVNPQQQQQPQQQHHPQKPSNHALEKSGKLLEMANDSSANTVKNIPASVINDAQKIAQIYQDTNEILDDKNEQNHYNDKNNDGSF